jgi:octanoyl-[GcvH]:protein N-octanoyltransferase
LTATRRELRLVVEPEVVDPVLDTALSRALLERVAAGELADTLRISRPGPAVAFGRRDAIADGYAEAVAAARAGGFEAVERLAGGRASVFHEQTLHIGLATHDSDPRGGVTRRFEQVAETLARAFVALGVDAGVGDVPGEYCPGEHSVNARGATKLAGLGQRVIRDGAYVGGVVVVDGAARIREGLAPVYAALGLDWLPETTGALADEAPGVEWDRVSEAIVVEYGAATALERATLGADTVELARRLAPGHRSLGY